MLKSVASREHCFGVDFGYTVARSVAAIAECYGTSICSAGQSVCLSSSDVLHRRNNSIVNTVRVTLMGFSEACECARVESVHHHSGK